MTRRDPEAVLPLRPADLQILLMLGDEPQHAYGISKAVEDLPAGAVRLEIGSLYRTLNRLVTEGLIAEIADASKGPQGQARRIYGITEFGRAVASAEARRLERVIDMARAGRFLPQSRG